GAARLARPGHLSGSKCQARGPAVEARRRLLAGAAAHTAGRARGVPRAIARSAGRFEPQSAVWPASQSRFRVPDRVATDLAAAGTDGSTLSHAYCGGGVLCLTAKKC